MENEIDKKLEELLAQPAGAPSSKKSSGFKAGLKKAAARLRRHPFITGGLVVAAAAFILIRLGASGADGGTRVSVTPLTKGGIQEILSLTGPVSGTDHVDVVSNIHAEIISMEVKEGDHVAKGQLLASLDPTDLTRDVEIARNAYEQAAAEKAQKDKEAALGYEKAVQDYEKASLDYNRSSVLFSTGAIPQTEMEQSTNALQDARRQMESYRVENGCGTADETYALKVEQAAFELAKKEEELENTQIKSPIDGTVVRVNSQVGQFADKVEDDKPIFSIENLENLELEIKVSEYSIGKVALGQKAVISADILNGATAEGEVIKISPTGEEKGDGSTERVVPAIIRVQGGDTRLMAGITARARLLVDEAEDVFTVPVSAVFEEGDTSWVAAVKDGCIHRIPVTTGIDGELNVELIPEEEGALTEGMLIVTTGGEALSEGQSVIPVDEQGGEV